MPYVNVPNDLSKIKTKLAFNLTKRQLVCFGIAAAVGIPSYLLARSAIGNTGAMFLMMAVALPAFLLAMYEKDGLPFEKVVRNILRARFLRPGVRPYQVLTDNHHRSVYPPQTIFRKAADSRPPVPENSFLPAGLFRIPDSARSIPAFPSSETTEDSRLSSPLRLQT